MNPYNQKERLQNIAAGLLGKLSQRAESLKIEEGNQVFRRIEREIVERFQQYFQQIAIGMRVEIKGFIREINSRMMSLSHAATWDQLVGF